MFAIGDRCTLVGFQTTSLTPFPFGTIGNVDDVDDPTIVTVVWDEGHVAVDLPVALLWKITAASRPAVGVVRYIGPNSEPLIVNAMTGVVVGSYFKGLGGSDLLQGPYYLTKLFQTKDLIEAVAIRYVELEGR